MKYLVCLLLTLSISSFAKDEKSLEERKQEILAKIDKRITALNAHKSCVQQASSKEELKKCRKDKDKKQDKQKRRGKKKK